MPRRKPTKGTGKGTSGRKRKPRTLFGRYRAIVAYRTAMRRSTERFRRIVPLTDNIAGKLHSAIAKSVRTFLPKYGPHVYVTLHIETIGPIYEARLGEVDPDEKVVTRFNSVVASNSVNDLLLNVQEALENVYAKTDGRYARLVAVDITMFKGYPRNGKIYLKPPA